MQINVHADYSRAMEKLQLTQRRASRALVRALDRTAAQALIGAARNIRDEGYGLKVGVIKTAFKVRRASEHNLVAVLNARGRPIPLIKYGARYPTVGYPVTVDVLHGRKVVPHAFVATTRTGHVGIFMRKGDQHKKVMRNGRAVWSGLPIRELFGPSIPAAFSNKAVMAAVEAVVRERFPENMRQALRYEGLRRVA